MIHSKNFGRLFALTAVVVAVAGGTYAEPPGRSFCSVPDDGTGTGTIPPVGCSYISPAEVFMIIDGLPPGTTIEAPPIHHSFFCPYLPCEMPGGMLGGTSAMFDSTLTLFMTGTGYLAGWNRQIEIPMLSVVHTGPRTLGDPVQTFPTDYFSFQGSLYGDPDFDTLTIVAGTDFGLPSPGQATMARRVGDSYSVDSFFDISYRIDFVGAPGGQLDGLSGSTMATIRMAVEAPPRSVGSCFAADNGTGTVELPPAPCEYLSPEEVFEIVDGLPAGTTLDLHPKQGQFICLNTPCGQPGGTLGGESEEFNSTLELEVVGTGFLAGYSRSLVLPAPTETHSAPRTPGDPVQHFNTDVYQMAAGLMGDPDFSSLAITAGSTNGFPGWGMATLTQQPDGTFLVDSFFDVNYRIDFVGAPGSLLDGMSGTTFGSVGVIAGVEEIFADGFESSDTSRWSVAMP